MGASMNPKACRIRNWLRRHSLPILYLSANIVTSVILASGGPSASRAQACPPTSANYPCAYAATSTGITVIDVATQTVLSTQIPVSSPADLKVSPNNSCLDI